MNSIDTNLLVHARGVKTFYTRNVKDFREFGLFEVIDPTADA